MCTSVYMPEGITPLVISSIANGAVGGSDDQVSVLPPVFVIFIVPSRLTHDIASTGSSATPMLGCAAAVAVAPAAAVAVAATEVAVALAFAVAVAPAAAV